MELEQKEKATLEASACEDSWQSAQSHHDGTIPAEAPEINYSAMDSQENFESFLRQMRHIGDPAYLHTVSMNELYETVYQSRPPVIDGLLYSGTYLFAGSPKVGKSFLMAQLAYHISTGQDLWNYTVHQGTVLYLALEDDYQRLQERMSRMFGVEGTDHLHFAVYAKQLGAGLDEQLELFIREHPDTRLIIIDTLQKIREVSTDAYSYANDYDIVGRMKQFADRHGVCLLLVHHTRKQQAGDKFEMISGTTGLLGCADGAFLLQKEKRTDLTATLEIVGRDQPDQKLHLTRDTERLVWHLDHAETELWKKPPDPLLVKIDSMLTEEIPTWNGSATELVTLLQSKLALDENGQPLRSKSGKPVLKKSYSVLQDDFFNHMIAAGYHDIQRGERGSSEEHLTVTQFKVEREQERLAVLTEQAQQKEAKAAALDKEIEKSKQKKVNIESIGKIEAKPVMLSPSRVSLEKSEYETLSTAARKYYAQEKKESKLRKLLDAANKMVEELKSKIKSLVAENSSLRDELSKYKSVRSKLNSVDLEQENERLLSRVRTYEEVISKNKLWHLFGKGHGKLHTRDASKNTV